MRLTLVLAAAGLVACRIETEIEVATDTDGRVDTDSEGLDDLPFPPAGPEAAPNPSLMGPYPVGVLTLTLADPLRTTAEGNPWPMVIEVWYPADEAARGGEGVAYGLSDVLSDDALALVPDPEAEVALNTEAVRDATPRSDDAPYPVVVFSHGAGGIRMQSTYLTVALASHGHVVVAPDHHGSTLSDLVLAGGVTPEMLAEGIEDRPADVRFVIDHLEALAPEDPLAAAIDLSRRAIVGHSFGGFTALRMLALGDDFDTAVAQAPPGYDTVWIGNPPVAPEDLGVPVMIQAGGHDMTTPRADAQTIFDRLSPPRTMIVLATAGHFTFSDLCRLDPAIIEGAMDLGLEAALTDGCDGDDLSPAIALPTIRHYTIAHLNGLLRTSPGSTDLVTAAAGEALAPGEIELLR